MNISQNKTYLLRIKETFLRKEIVNFLMEGMRIFLNFFMEGMRIFLVG